MTTDRVSTYPDRPAGSFEAPPRSFEDDEGRTIRLAAAEDGDRSAAAEDDDRSAAAEDDDRSAAAEDGEVGATDVEGVVEMYAAFDPGDRAQGIPPTGEERIRSWVEGLFEDGVNVVARHEGSVVGHATLVPDGDGGYELAVFVLGEYQGAGIGTELIRALLGQGQREGVEKVWLTVEPWNRAAIHVYEKVGFEPCGTGNFERRFSIRLG